MNWLKSKFSIFMFLCISVSLIYVSEIVQLTLKVGQNYYILSVVLCITILGIYLPIFIKKPERLKYFISFVALLAMATYPFVVNLERFFYSFDPYFLKETLALILFLFPLALSIGILFKKDYLKASLFFGVGLLLSTLLVYLLGIFICLLVGSIVSFVLSFFLKIESNLHELDKKISKSSFRHLIYFFVLGFMLAFYFYAILKLSFFSTNQGLFSISLFISLGLFLLFYFTGKISKKIELSNDKIPFLHLAGFFYVSFLYLVFFLFFLYDFALINIAYLLAILFIIFLLGPPLFLLFAPLFILNKERKRPSKRQISAFAIGFLLAIVLSSQVSTSGLNVYKYFLLYAISNAIIFAIYCLIKKLYQKPVFIFSFIGIFFVLILNYSFYFYDKKSECSKHSESEALESSLSYSKTMELANLFVNYSTDIDHRQRFLNVLQVGASYDNFFKNFMKYGFLRFDILGSEYNVKDEVNSFLETKKVDGQRINSYDYSFRTFLNLRKQDHDYEYDLILYLNEENKILDPINNFTMEFLSKTWKSLSNRGVLCIRLMHNENYKKLATIYRTLKKLYANVYVFSLMPDKYISFVAVKSYTKIDLNKLSNDLKNNRSLTKIINLPSLLALNISMKDFPPEKGLLNRNSDNYAYSILLQKESFNYLEQSFSTDYFESSESKLEELKIEALEESFLIYHDNERFKVSYEKYKNNFSQSQRLCLQGLDYLYINDQNLAYKSFIDGITLDPNNLVCYNGLYNFGVENDKTKDIARFYKKISGRVHQVKVISEIVKVMYYANDISLLSTSDPVYIDTSDPYEYKRILIYRLGFFMKNTHLIESTEQLERLYGYLVDDLESLYKNDEEKSRFYFIMGSIANYLGQEEQAKDFFKKSLKSCGGSSCSAGCH
ncbi:MAG: hypothetical protein ABIA04_02260 [Pseudomonadota bacterium]